MRRFFIDDERFPPDDGNEWEIFRTSQDAIHEMEDGCPSFISFDHDLGGDDTAMAVVDWMINTDLDMQGGYIPKDFSFYVHSQNSVGRENIERKLSRYLLFRSEG
jgi:hypothetical protein